MKQKLEKNRPLTNEEILKRRNQRKILWYLIIIFGIMTLILAICSLVFKISPIFCVITFILETIFTKCRNGILLK